MFQSFQLMWSLKHAPFLLLCVCANWKQRTCLTLTGKYVCQVVSQTLAFGGQISVI